MLSYLVSRRPFKKNRFNIIEIFNEVSLLCICMTYFAFTDFVDYAETKLIMGWICMVIILINFGINLSVLCYFTIRKVLKFIRKRLAVRKYN
jgi:hypothetical protein